MADYQETPIGNSLYSRFRMDMIDDVEVAQANTPEFFMSFFGPRNGGKTYFAWDDSEFEIEIQRAGKQYMAPLIPRNINSTMGTVQKRNAESRRSIVARTFPLAEEKASVTSDELNKLIPGERYLSMQLGREINKIDRFRYWSGRKINEQVANMKRLYEYLAAQVVLYGTMPAVIGGGADVTYDFRRLGTHYIDNNLAKWTTAGTDIYGDLDFAITLIEDDSYLTDNYTIAILGDSVSAGIFANTKILADLDIRRFGNGSIEMHSDAMLPEDVQHCINMGCKPIGFLTTPKSEKVYLLNNKSYYHNSSGTKTFYLPATSVLVYKPSVRGDRIFGPHERGLKISADRQEAQELFGFDSDAPMVTNPDIDTSQNFVKESLYFDFSRSSDKKRVELVTQAAPIFAPYNVNGFVHYYNCA